MPNTKIATCCYCGTRAALVLRGKERHELSCSTCGAPLHELKMLRQEKIQPALRSSHVKSPKKSPKRSYKKKRRKGFKDFLLDEVWDAIEDIFD